MAQEWYIYRITCLPTGKSYVGQTQRYKDARGKPYEYGVVGRWCDHVSSSKRSSTPLHLAIREHGPSQFVHEILESVDEAHVNEREAYWIRTLETAVPIGYNVNAHSRCKHRSVDDAASIYLDVATRVEMKPILRNGEPRLVYIYVETPNGKKRLTFGQSNTGTFEQAMDEAHVCLAMFQSRGVPVVESRRHQLEQQSVQRVRMVPYNKTMVAVYITTTDGNQQRTCFGGKHITYNDAVERALHYVSGLQCNEVDNQLSKSQQQVAPRSDEAKSE